MQRPMKPNHERWVIDEPWRVEHKKTRCQLCKDPSKSEGTLRYYHVRGDVIYFFVLCLVCSKDVNDDTKFIRDDTEFKRIDHAMRFAYWAKRLNLY